MAEGGTGGFDVGGKLGFVERFFGRRIVFLGDDVIDGLFHLLLFFICSKNTTDLISPTPTFLFFLWSSSRMLTLLFIIWSKRQAQQKLFKTFSKK